MKKNLHIFIKAVSALLLITMCAGALAGCGETAPAESEAGKTEAQTETKTEAPTEAPTEKATEPPETEAPETEPPAVVTPAEIDASAAIEKGVLSYFSGKKYCDITDEEDAEEGKVIRISTSGIKKANQRMPVVYFNYGKFCESIGEKGENLAEKPFVVMKVREEKLHDRKSSLLGSEEDNDKKSVGYEIFTNIHSGGWHYVAYDFSAITNAAKIASFRIGIEQYAGENGESLYISEFRLCTAEEAAELVTPDVYEIEEQTADNYTLRLLQFNIQTENGNAAPFINRSEMYRRLVEELRPDVVGMEECTVNWRKWLDEYVFNDSYEGVGEARTSGGEANPIYYRKDKFELVDSGTFWLSDTPDKVGSMLQGVNYPRICTWVILKDKATGVQFAHMNTHLDHNGNNDSTTGNNIRKAQMAVIVKFAAEKFGDMPQFLSGDLNNRRTTSKGEIYALYKMITGEKAVKEEDGTTYKMSLADSRLNAAVTVDENHTATMTKYYDETGASYEPTREPIDYVFYNPANTEALTYETFLVSEDGLWISDHLPVFTTFKIKTQ